VRPVLDHGVAAQVQHSIDRFCPATDQGTARVHNSSTGSLAA
jgi:hypothetical protein